MRHIYTQSQIVEKFKDGEINGIELRSHRGNYRASNNTITHYSTTEAIKTNDGTLIGSSQCWAAGFASCAFSGGNCRLPLSTLEGIIDVHTIEIIDRDAGKWEPDVLFSATNSSLSYEREEARRYFLFGHDEFRPFLTELPIEVNTVREAFEVLTPKDAKGKNVKRQGDLFFVKTKFTDKQVRIDDYEHYTKYCNWKNVSCYKMEEYPEYASLQQDGNRYYETRINASKFDYDTKCNTVNYRGDSPLKQCITLSVIRKVLAKEVIKEHHKPQILGTNHKINKIGSVNGFYTLVKGQVSHDRHQHSRLDLRDAWYAVYKNLAKQSWQVDRRSSGGAD